MAVKTDSVLINSNMCTEMHVIITRDKIRHFVHLK